MLFKRLFFMAIGVACIYSSTLPAAMIEISDGSILVGEVVARDEDKFTVRLKSGSTVDIRGCNIVQILVEGDEKLSDFPVPQPAPLRFAGSYTVGERLVPSIAKAFVVKRGAKKTYWLSEKENERTLVIEDAKGCEPNRIEVKAHGSSTGFQALDSGQAEVGMSSRPIKSEEVQKLARLGNLRDPDTEHVLALDGVTVIVNQSNPVKTLNRYQIAAIFSGSIKSWSDVGGDEAPINVYAHNDKSGTFDTFNHLVLEERSLSLVSSAKRFESNINVSDAVASDPNGIGFVGFPYVRSAKALAIDECGLIYAPHPFAVKTEEYPLARRLFLYTPRASDIVQQFNEFALSDEGQGVAREHGFIDLAIEPADSEEVMPDMRIARMRSAIDNVQNLATTQELIKIIEGATRLSVTFRFRPGSATLDTRALGDVKRLAKYMKEGEGRNKQVMLLGFADSNGEYARNLALSKTRAQAVAAQLARNGVRGAFFIRGFGEEAPIACNDQEGSDKNRRVEVWVQ